MKKNLYNAVHRYFYIDLSNRKHKEVEVLAEKTSIPAREISELLAILETKEVSSVSDTFVAEAQKRQRSFYRRAGIIPDTVLSSTKDRKLVIRRGLLIPGILLLVGLIGTVLGLYFLTAALALGIILWPTGTALFLLGVARITRPYIVIDGGKIKILGSIYTNHEFELEGLTKIEQIRGGSRLQFGEKSMMIYHWEMGAFEVEQFKLFLNKLEK